MRVFFFAADLLLLFPQFYIFLSSFDAGNFYAVCSRCAAELCLSSCCSIRVCTYLMSSNPSSATGNP